MLFHQRRIALLTVTNLTFRSVILFQHLYVRVVGETSFTDGGEVGLLPARAVDVLLDLRSSHDRIGSEVVSDFVTSLIERKLLTHGVSATAHSPPERPMPSFRHSHH